MNIVKVAVTAIAVCLFVESSQAQAQASGVPPTPSSTQPAPALADRKALETFIDGIVQGQLESNPVPGAAVAVVKDGRVIFTKGYGYADLETKRPVDPAGTVFRIGSVAKLFVGTAVMQLAEQGKLDLDADINGYLSAFQVPATYPEPITLKHLLTHSAGFEERIIGADADWPEDGTAPLVQSLQNFMPARVRPPGRIASYSNWGVTLAGHIVARVSGMPFAEYAERNIFAPLQMANSTFLEPLPAPLAGALAVGYHYEDGVFQAQDFEFVSDYGPAGAMSSTAVDMAHFMIAHLQGGRFGDARILSEDAAILMHRRHFGSHPRLPGMAISFGESHHGGRYLLQHSGATLAFHANLALLPRAGVGLFVACNGPGPAGDEILVAFLDRYFPTPEPAKAAPSTDFGARSARYVGSYRGNRLAFKRLEKAMRFNELTVHDGGRGTLFLGDLLSDTTNPEHGLELVEIAPNLFRNEDKGVLVAFSGGAAGEVTNLFVGAAINSFHRIAWYETVHALGGVMALTFIIFFLACVARFWGLVRRRRQSPNGPVLLRVNRGLLLAMCLANAVFAAGFTAMVLTNDDPFSYPPGTEVMLALPVASVGLTLAAMIFAFFASLKRYGSIGSRLRDAGLILTSAAFLWFLALWNMIGWQL